MIISAKISHADLLAAPDDGKQREIIDGEMLVTPAPRMGHQRIVSQLAQAFYRYLARHPVGELILSPMDVILSEYDVLEPDLIFVSNERQEIVSDWVRGAPDLVIEILSPTTVARDRGVKLRTYARFGVKEYWIVDPDERAIEVYCLVREGYELVKAFKEPEALVSGLLPGFFLDIPSVFKS
jgi:Uma2 family endonuclease